MFVKPHIQISQVGDSSPTTMLLPSTQLIKTDNDLCLCRSCFTLCSTLAFLLLPPLITSGNRPVYFLFRIHVVLWLRRLFHHQDIANLALLYGWWLKVLAGSGCGKGRGCGGIAVGFGLQSSKKKKSRNNESSSTKNHSGTSGKQPRKERWWRGTINLLWMLDLESEDVE